MEELIENCARIPMTRKVLVDEDRLLDFMDRIRTTMPDEIRQAKWIIQEREKVIADSKREAERVLEDAQKEIEKQAEESEVARQARMVAEEIINKAKTIAQEIRDGARAYADDVLKSLAENTARVMEQIQQGRDELKEMK
jgi:cell division septum initiation protein DivIVA